MGHGLFDRVHVADRPAYLTALADAAALGESRSVEFRVRRDGDSGPQRGDHFVWIEMRCRPLEQAADDAADAGEREVVAVLRDVTERKDAGTGAGERARGGRARQCRQEPLPRHHEP